MIPCRWVEFARATPEVGIQALEVCERAYDELGTHIARAVPSLADTRILVFRAASCGQIHRRIRSGHAGVVVIAGTCRRERRLCAAAVRSGARVIRVTR